MSYQCSSCLRDIAESGTELTRSEVVRGKKKTATVSCVEWLTDARLGENAPPGQACPSLRPAMHSISHSISQTSWHRQEKCLQEHVSLFCDKGAERNRNVPGTSPEKVDTNNLSSHV